MLAAVGERSYRVAERGPVDSGDGVRWMRGWLVVGPRCIAAAAADVVPGLVSGPCGIVAGQSGVVFCGTMKCPVHEASWPGSRA